MHKYHFTLFINQLISYQFLEKLSKKLRQVLAFYIIPQSFYIVRAPHSVALTPIEKKTRTRGI